MFGVGLTLPKVSAVLLNAIGGLLAAYKINDLTPDLVADFNGSLNEGTEFYDAGGTVDTFAELITHSPCWQCHNDRWVWVGACYEW